MTPTLLIDSSSCYVSGKPEALFNFHIKRDTTSASNHRDSAFVGLTRWPH